MIGGGLQGRAAVTLNSIDRATVAASVLYGLRVSLGGQRPRGSWRQWDSRSRAGLLAQTRIRVQGLGISMYALENPMRLELCVAFARKTVAFSSQAPQKCCGSLQAQPYV